MTAYNTWPPASHDANGGPARHRHSVPDESAPSDRPELARAVTDPSTALAVTLPSFEAFTNSIAEHRERERVAEHQKAEAARGLLSIAKDWLPRLPLLKDIPFVDIKAKLGIPKAQRQGSSSVPDSCQVESEGDRPRKSETSPQLPTGYFVNFRENPFQALAIHVPVFPLPATIRQATHNGRDINRYKVDGKWLVMYTVPNEMKAVFRRVTKGGRELEYHLEVIQPPIRARACGSGDKAGSDRRPVDPPPVVRLNIFCNGSDVTSTYESQFMLYVGLEHARPHVKGPIAGPKDAPCYAVLKGQSVAGAAYLAKPVAAAYFIFGDLSVQNEGYYRLKFQLFEQPRDMVDWSPARAERAAMAHTTLDGPDEEEAMELMTHVYSRPFQVYSAKKFPGLEASTELSKLIAEQGCRVRIRRDIRQRRDGNKGKGKDDDMAGYEAAYVQEPSTYPYPYAHAHEQYRRQSSYDTRRVSVDGQTVQAPTYVSTHQPAYSNYGTLPSSSTVAPAQQPHMYQQRSAYVAEPEDMSHHSTPQRPQLQIPNAQSSYRRDSHSSITPAPPTPAAAHTSSLSNRLPSINHLLNEPLPMPPKPEAPYQTTSMSGSKRGFSESREERDNPVQERARPKLMPYLRGSTGLASTPAIPQYTARHGLVGGDAFIEADDEDEDSEEDEDDAKVPSFYRRANGTSSLISSAPPSWSH